MVHNPLENTPPPSSHGKDKLSPHRDTAFHSLDWQTQKFVTRASKGYGKALSVTSQTAANQSNFCRLRSGSCHNGNCVPTTGGSLLLDLPLHLWNCAADSTAWKELGGEQEDEVCVVYKVQDWEATEVLLDGGEVNEGHLRMNCYMAIW